MVACSSWVDGTDATGKDTSSQQQHHERAAGVREEARRVTRERGVIAVVDTTQRERGAVDTHREGALGKGNGSTLRQRLVGTQQPQGEPFAVSQGSVAVFFAPTANFLV